MNASRIEGLGNLGFDSVGAGHFLITSAAEFTETPVIDKLCAVLGVLSLRAKR
jgi:hypothetical protein